MANKELIKAVDLIREDDGWWKESARERFIEAGQKMLDAGMSLSDVRDILTDLYFAVASEYGE